MGPEPKEGWPAGTVLGWDPIKCEFIIAAGKPANFGVGVVGGGGFGDSIIYNPDDMPGCPWKFKGANYCGSPFKKD